MVLIKKVVIDRLSNNSLLDKQTILQLPVAYRTTIARNLLGLLEGRLICYEPTPTVTNHICCITVPIFLRRKIFTLRCATPLTGHMCMALNLDFSDLDYVLTLLIG